MLESLKKQIANKRILILGFGREGRSTLQFLVKHLPESRITVADINENLKPQPDGLPEEKSDIQFSLGKDYLNKIDSFDTIFRSPGVSIPEHLLTAGLKKRITSQTDLFLKIFAGQTIGVTGTKGKSTTSSLICHIFKENGRDSVLVGNIGTPPLDYFDEIKPETRIVFELSSMQLEDITMAPGYALLLNLYDEHLDRYQTSGAYHEAKLNILIRQKKGNIFIYNKDNQVISDYLKGHTFERQFFQFSCESKVENGAFCYDGSLYLSVDGRRKKIIDISDENIFLKGNHNLMNILSAVPALYTNGITIPEIAKGIKTFKGLEHRMEYTGTFAGIRFYNDSIATIPEAVIEAVKALQDVDTLILGGYDRGLDYSGLVGFLKGTGVRNIFFMGPAGERMLRQFKDHQTKKNLFLIQDLDEAFKIIPECTKPGSICLLSPAAASYDMFRDFEERGNYFKRLAAAL